MHRTERVNLTPCNVSQELRYIKHNFISFYSSKIWPRDGRVYEGEGHKPVKECDSSFSTGMSRSIYL